MCVLFLKGVMEQMRIVYDPTVDALTIRFVEERMECEVIRGIIS